MYGVGEILGSCLSVFIITKLGARNTFNLGVLGAFAFVSILVFVEFPVTAIAVGLLLLRLSDQSYSMAFWRICIPQDRARTGTLSSLGNVSFAGAITIVTGLGTPLIEIFWLESSRWGNFSKSHYRCRNPKDLPFYSTQNRESA